MRRGCLARLRQLLPGGNQNRLRHALVEGNNRVPQRPIRPRIVKDANHGGVAPLHHAHNAAHAAAVGLGRLHFHQHLVALHGAVDLVGRNKYVFLRLIAWRALGRTKP